MQQAALRNLDRAFVNFFAGRAKYPIFKRKSEREGSFVVRDLAVRRLNRRWGVVTIPKVGPVRFRISRVWAEIEKATSARITHGNGRWHIAFTTLPAEKIEAGTGDVVGIDRGVKNTLATSEGQMLQAPSLRVGEQARFLALQRQLARQQKGSTRHRATLDQLAGLRRRVQDRRADWLEQATPSLARQFDLIGVQDLRVRFGNGAPRSAQARPRPRGRFPSQRRACQGRAHQGDPRLCVEPVPHPPGTQDARRACGPGRSREHQSHVRVLRAHGSVQPRAERCSPAKPVAPPRTPTPTRRSSSSTAR